MTSRKQGRLCEEHSSVVSTVRERADPRASRLRPCVSHRARPAPSGDGSSPSTSQSACHQHVILRKPCTSYPTLYINRLYPRWESIFFRGALDLDS